MTRTAPEEFTMFDRANHRTAVSPSPRAGWVFDATSCACPLCWGQRAIWEHSPLGLVPVVCDGCDGTGRRSGG